MHSEDEMVHINLDLDEDVEAGDLSGVYGNQAAMTVMNEEVSSERGGREVVDAAGTVGYIAEYKTVSDVGEGGKDVREDEGIHEEAFGQLEGDALGVSGAEAPDALVDLEVVVGGEEGDGGVEGGIVEDGTRDLVLNETFRHRFPVTVAYLERQNGFFFLFGLLIGFHHRRKTGLDSILISSFPEIY